VLARRTCDVCAGIPCGVLGPGRDILESEDVAVL
jgi:hypothetical protein